MPDSATIIRDGQEAHRLQITHRDWMLLGEPGFVEGYNFIRAFGIFENFSVASGMPKGASVYRDGQTLLGATMTLFGAIQQDFDLLCFDYSVKVGSLPKHTGGSQGIQVGGRPGYISLRRKGHCSIAFVDQLVPARIDLRDKDGFKTDDGEIKIYRRRAECGWLDILPPLITFLQPRLTTTLSLEHIDRLA